MGLPTHDLLHGKQWLSRGRQGGHIRSPGMEAHEALSRHEHVSGRDDDLRDGLARPAALVVAVIAAFLAVATFMANEAVKEAVTGETKAADTSARLEANETKLTIAEGTATLLAVTDAGTP